MVLQNTLILCILKKYGSFAVVFTWAAVKKKCPKLCNNQAITSAGSPANQLLMFTGSKV